MKDTQALQKSTTILKVTITFFLIGLAVAAMFAFTPKGFDLDLSKVGQGKPALVFVYDSNLTASQEQAKSLNQARDNTEGNVIFLVAKIGRPDAQAFVNKYNLRSIDFALLDANGKLIHTAPGLLTEQQIKAMIQPVLNK